MADNDKVFAGAVPKLYETLLVPLIFQPYAADVAERIGTINYEVTCGIGRRVRYLHVQ